MFTSVLPMRMVESRRVGSASMARMRSPVLGRWAVMRRS